ncbi:MAG: Unknown protein [uncultured Sulfurovum sp.]|uniref:Uncharacterized protein n=1 Tax=uncultured Sulfurovum sp. TaxID=269237 RepID=A0A6S6SR78_9BACT|nr:MAG: Unknown protein [uncultured Sulfurovum sp.]
MLKKKESLPKYVKKSIAIALYLDSALIAYKEDMGSIDDNNLAILKIQIKKALSVVNYKVSGEYYSSLYDEIRGIWKELSEDSRDTETEELPLLIELLCMLISPDSFKVFFGMKPYKGNIVSFVNKPYSELVSEVLLLDTALNQAFDTKSYTLALPKEKKKRKKTVRKTKPLTTPKKKNLKQMYKTKSLREQEEAAKRKLSSIIEAAKKKASTNNDE